MATAEAIKPELARLLADLLRRGIGLRPDPADAARLRYRPAAAVTPELAERIRAHKPDLLAILRAGAPVSAPDPADAATLPQDAPAAATAPDYTPAERAALAAATPALRATVERIKAAFADTGGATVLDVYPEPVRRREHRRRAAAIIRRARRRGGRDRAAALRDAWRERVAIVAADADCRLMAEQVAADELAATLSYRQ